jgi:Putative DNA-binding domain
MKQLLTKPLSDVNASDVSRLIDNGEEESLILELKGALPTPKNQTDPWEEGRNRILDYTRDEVLTEVVGMVNAAGGVVLLGVDESDDEPRRAKAPRPLRDCVQLASRFEDMAWACIEPRLPSLEVKGIPLSIDGAGVALLRVPSPSLRAPHGLTTKHRAYVRRGSKTEPMLVSEIRERTLQTQRQLDELERRFTERQQEFGKWWPARDVTVVAIRTTVAPAAPVVSADAPYAYHELWPNPGEIRCLVNGRASKIGIAPRWDGRRGPTPILRGAASIFRWDDAEETMRQFVFWDGLTDLWVRRTFRDPLTRVPIYMEELLGAAYEALRIAKLVARHGGAPGVDLLMEVELASDKKGGHLMGLSGAAGDGNLHFQEFPRQGVVGEDLAAPIKGLLNDLLNAAGLPTVTEFSLED